MWKKTSFHNDDNKLITDIKNWTTFNQFFNLYNHDHTYTFLFKNEVEFRHFIRYTKIYNRKKRWNIEWFEKKIFLQVNFIPNI